MNAQNKVTVLAAWAATALIACFCFALAFNNQAIPSELSYALATVLGVAGGATIPHLSVGEGVNVAEAISAHSASVSSLLHEMTSMLGGGTAGGSAPPSPVVRPSATPTPVAGGPVVDTVTNKP